MLVSRMSSTNDESRVSVQLTELLWSRVSLTDQPTVQLWKLSRHIECHGEEQGMS